MNNLGIFGTIILMGALQGFILTIVLLRIKNKNVVANRFLALFLLLISFTMLGRLVTETKIIDIFPNFLALPDAIIFLYGPLMYLYLRKLLVLVPLNKTKLYLLFVPAFLFLLSEIPLLLNENHSLKILWIQHTTFRFIVVEGFAILHNVYFVVLGGELFLKYQKTSNNNFAYKQYPGYLKAIFILISLTLCIWLISYFSWVTGYNFILSNIGYRTIWLILPFITYLLGYFAMKNPDFFRINSQKKNSPKKIFNTDEKQLILEQFQDVMMHQKLFIEPKFSLLVLSVKLSIDRNRLSQFINDEFQRNFNDWTNDYRIIEAKSLLIDSDLSIKEIYYNVGFNSKSAFNSAFKKRMNKTPSEFRSQKT